MYIISLLAFTSMEGLLQRKWDDGPFPPCSSFSEKLSKRWVSLSHIKSHGRQTNTIYYLFHPTQDIAFPTWGFSGTRKPIWWLHYVSVCKLSQGYMHVSCFMVILRYFILRYVSVFIVYQRCTQNCIFYCMPKVYQNHICWWLYKFNKQTNK